MQDETLTFPDETQAVAAVKKRGQKTAEAAATAAVCEGTAEVRIDKRSFIHARAQEKQIFTLAIRGSYSCRKKHCHLPG